MILDDGGYGSTATEQALNLDPGVTLAILPNTPNGSTIAQRGIEKGFEVILHMPLHADGIKTFPGEIGMKMDRDTVQKLTLDALAQVPGAKGVNYHTGTTLIQDPDRTKWFLEVVRDKGLYFVDSRTTGKTLGFSTAVSLGIHSANRDVFIDNSSELDAIRTQFEILVKTAKQKGTAIGIGHFRRNTIVVLKEKLPTLKERGIALVHASELVQ